MAHGGDRAITRSIGAIVGVFATVFLAGCPGIQVTGRDPVTRSGSQAETALTTSFANKRFAVIAAYNDETGSEGTISYTPTTRVVSRGASLMGWSYSLDNGKTWAYGGKVKPPPGIAVLWGDPAITTSERSYRFVFMSNLAIPDAKMPASGSFEGPVNSFIGGACIARSTDGGITFLPHATLSNQGHFYDGGSMAAARSGDIYSAFVDVNTDQIDVWRAADESSAFQLLPPPFPNLRIYSHPRIRVNPDDGSLYVAAQGSDYAVYMARWTGHSWGNAMRASEPGLVYPTLTFPSGMRLRTGPQFAFDIGVASSDGHDAIRLLCTRKSDTGRFFIAATVAPADLSNFQLEPKWNMSTPFGHCFNPNVCAWRGFFGSVPVWKAACVTTDSRSGNRVTLTEGNLAYLSDGTPLLFPVDVLRDIPVYSDLRGYWGDYDDLVAGAIDNDRTTPTFIRTISDSSGPAVRRWQFTSSPLHITAARTD